MSISSNTRRLSGAILSVFLLLLAASAGRAALPADARTRDFVVDLSATVSDTSPCIVLSWTLTQHLQSYIGAQMIYRRLKGETIWVKLADLTTTDTSYADTTAVPGVEYEYWMRRDFTNIGSVPVGSAPSFSNAMGYISAGVKVPEVHARGKLLLLVDDTMVTPLVPEITQLKDDLTGDGWTVQQITAPRSGTPISTKALIKAAYDADPANVNALYILGHVPVPYSGDLYPPDGHTNVSGAWVADGYYGEMNGTWTDTTVNTSKSPETTNVPGDGRFDQSYWPSALELEVGRVDMWALTKAPSSAVTETALLRRYLRRAHDFRFKQGEYANIRRRTLILDSGVLLSGVEPITINFWATGFNSVPEPPAAAVIEEPAYGQWFTNTGANSYLMGEAFGGGEYEGDPAVGTSTDFGLKANRVVFMAEMASQFGNWNGANNLMRSIIAGNADGTNLALTCFWVGRPNYFLHHMGMGETIGYSTRVSQNSYFSTYPNYYSPSGYFRGYTHQSLLGDPALRMHIVEPPRGLSATSAGGQVVLDWADSTEPRVQGYHVYRAATSAGPFTRLTPTPVAASNFTDATATAGQTYTYMVRTQKLEYAPGGSYNNLSNGVMAALGVNSGGTSAPGNPSNLTVSQNGGGVLGWTDNSNDETGFRIERKVNAGGTYATLATVAANATGTTDPGPFADGNVYYYRVIATGSGGDSIASNETSFDAVAGYIKVNSPKLKVSKTAGTAQIPVERFGGSAGAVTLSYSAINASAVAGTHFTAPSGTLTWADGELGVKNIPVAITNTPTPQQPRQFTITLNSATGGAGIGEYRNVAVVIEDPTASLPSPWSENVMGGVSDSSPAVQAEGALGSALIGGGGLLYSSAIDQGHFIYQSRTGDASLTAYIPAASPVQPDACFAVMVRDNLIGGSPMAATVVTGSANIGTQFMYRTSGYAGSVVTGMNTAQQAPCWVKITRAGDTFTSESSTDGVNWTTRGSATVPLGSTALWGVFHVSQIINSSTGYGTFQLATFQNVSFGAQPAPATPTNLALTTPTSTSVSLTWTASLAATGYRIERSVGGGSFAPLADVSYSAGNTYTDYTVSALTAYQYRILAYNATGDSDWSPAAGITTPATPLHPQTIISDTFTGTNGILLSAHAPDTNLPGGSFQKNSAAWGEPNLSNNSAQASTDVGVGISLASSGTYVKPTTLAISADLKLGTLTGTGANSSGIGLGFFSTMAASGHGSWNFNGLVLQRDGGLKLVWGGDAWNGAYGTPIPYTGTFNPAVAHALSYQIDTATGMISNVLLDGHSYTFSTTRFTNAATAYAGFYVNGSAPGELGSMDNFQVTDPSAPPPSAFDTWAAAFTNPLLADPDPAADPDGDGVINLAEFAFNGDPRSGSSRGLMAPLVQDSSAPAGNELTLVIAVRDGATFAAGSGGVQTASVDGITYTIEGSLNLTFPNAAVTHSAGPSDTAPAANLPDLTGTGWEYHTFKLDASEGLSGKFFLRAKVSQP